MKITVTSNFGDIAKRINEVGSQARYAAAVALTKTAREDVKPALISEMQSVFDRPTRYTLNSLYVKPATKANLEAFIWLKDDAGKGTPADRYLKPQIFGGTRSWKSMEKALQAAGMMQRGYYAVPAAGAQLDSFGNVKRSQIVQILSQLQVQRGGGYDARRSNSTRSKRTVRRQGVTYFALAKAKGRLKPGIYLKRLFSRGSAIRPVFIFVPAVAYKERFKFFEVGQRVADKALPERFEVELKKAIDTALLKTQGSFF
jgi:hypothetical protein